MSKVKINDKERLLVAEHALFSRFLFFATLRKLDMREVFQYPLGPVAWSLAHNDGSMRHTNKSTFGLSLQNRVPAVLPPQDAVVIVDLMPILWKLNADGLTFFQMSEQLFKRILAIIPSSWRVLYLVGENYYTLSVKNSERSSRGSGVGVMYTSIVGGFKISGWKKVLKCVPSKKLLIKFLAEDWTSNQKLLEMLRGRPLYVTKEHDCIMVDSSGKPTYIYMHD